MFFSELTEKLFLAVAQLGPTAYWLVFLVSFLESLAFVGMIFPGASLVIFAGFLSSQGSLDAGSLIFFAFFGALLGDNLSFWLGTKNSCWFNFKNNSFFKKYWERGCCFLNKYQMESIFLARFFGPARAIIPFISGVNKLPFKAFFFWNLGSVGLWSISHILLGHFFGASLEIFGHWIKKGHYLLLFAFFFFGFFYFGKKILFYQHYKQFFNNKKGCLKKQTGLKTKRG